MRWPRSASASARGPPTRRPSWHATTRSRSSRASGSRSACWRTTSTRAAATSPSSPTWRWPTASTPGSRTGGSSCRPPTSRVCSRSPTPRPTSVAAATPAVLTVTVSADAPVLPPIARDIVVPATDTLDRTEVSVDVLAVAQNPSGPLSDLEVSVPGSQADVARVSESGEVVVTLVDHAQTVPYLLTNRTGDQPGRVLRVHHRAGARVLPARAATEGARAARRVGGAASSSRSASRSRWHPGARRGSPTRWACPPRGPTARARSWTTRPSSSRRPPGTPDRRRSRSPSRTRPPRGTPPRGRPSSRSRSRCTPSTTTPRRSSRRPSTWLPGSPRSPSTSGPSPRDRRGRTRRTVATRTRWSRRSPPGSRATSPTAC